MKRMIRSHPPASEAMHSANQSLFETPKQKAMRRRPAKAEAAAKKASSLARRQHRSGSSTSGGRLLRHWRLISLAVGAAVFVLSLQQQSGKPPLSMWASVKRALLAAYLCTYLDRTSHKDGSRAWPWFQRLPYWRLLALLLRGRVIVEQPLDNKKQYIFTCHPHGINTWSHFLTMTDGCGFLSQNYAKERRDLAASILFLIPVCKDVLLWLGCVDAGAATAHKVLGEGHSSLIYVGGEKEQILTERGRDVVVVTPRKGFIKLALQYGTPLVPCFAFGESDLYFTFNHGKEFQLWLASTYKIAFPPCWGFLLPFWPIPVPLTLVCGAPIPVSMTESPTPEQIDALQQRYIAALKALYDRHKVQCGGRSPDAVLDVR